jgi:hypothetical protein
MRIICYVSRMRRDLLRSLSAFIGGTAFAIAVAGPPQWCPCPEHGAQLPTAAAQAQPDMPLDMQMPATEHDAPVAHGHSHHDAPASHHTGHQCTCPGGCCSSTPFGLRAPQIHAPVALQITVASYIAEPTDMVELASSPQLALPLANAPPALRVTPHHAANTLT